ncbi:hypothetical protein P7K49_037952, partial [Saguinus oedipus]
MEAWSGRGLEEAELRPRYFRSRDAHAVDSGLKSAVSPAPGVDAMVLFPVIGKLLHKRVVLASSCPRRREILSNA